MTLSEQQEEILEKIKTHEDYLKQLYKDLNYVKEQMLENNKEYFKCVCIGCNGTGWVKKDDKKISCSLCNGKLYNWVKKFKE